MTIQLVNYKTGMSGAQVFAKILKYYLVQKKIRQRWHFDGKLDFWCTVIQVHAHCTGLWG